MKYIILFWVTHRALKIWYRHLEYQYSVVRTLVCDDIQGQNIDDINTDIATKQDIINATNKLNPFRRIRHNYYTINVT